MPPKLAITSTVWPKTNRSDAARVASADPTEAQAVPICKQTHFRGPRRFAAALLCAVCAAPGWADRVELVAGDVLQGTVVSHDDQQLVMDHPALGQITFAADQIASVQRDQSQVTPPADETQPAPLPRQSPAEAGQQALIQAAAFQAANQRLRLWQGWKNKIEVSFTGREGNTRSQTYGLRFRSNRETDHHRTNVDSRARFARNRSRTSDQEFMLQVQHDFLIEDSRWFPFVRGQYDYDRFEDWEHRVQGFAGFGFRAVDDPKFKAELRFAGGVTHEFEGMQDTRAEGLLSAAVIEWRPIDGHKVLSGATWFPNLDNGDDYRIVSNIEWQIRMPSVDGLFLKIGLENEYETDISPGERRNDTRYYSGIVYEF